MERKIEKTPIQRLTWKSSDNLIDIKRDDMIPFSFGGNKVRIGYEYWMDARAKGHDSMVAYGSSRSNLCRVIANLCKASEMDCCVVSPMEEDGGASANSRILETFDTPMIICQKNEVAQTLERLMEGLRLDGRNPYYIFGDSSGHGHETVGNLAYEKAFLEIQEQEEEIGYAYDYIVLASGTGTTQSGLISGQAKYGGEQKIIGISIAREKAPGIEAIQSKLPSHLWDQIQFFDEYRGDGYGDRQEEVGAVIRQMMEWNGIPMDSTYTGKAFWGMIKWLEERQIHGARILFLHTGGTPLYSDELYDQTRIDG